MDDSQKKLDATDLVAAGLFGSFRQAYQEQHPLDPAIPAGGYEVLYADPPWNYRDKKKNRGGAERHYPTMTEKELAELDIDRISADDSVLLMWATFPKLQEALDLMATWGFSYKTAGFVWVKRNKVADSWFWGMGSWTRANAEVCLLGVKGKPERVSRAVHSVIDERIGRHSAKPDEVKRRIEQLLGDATRLELFSRGVTPGWDAYGNEIEGSIVIPKRPPELSKGGAT